MKPPLRPLAAEPDLAGVDEHHVATGVALLRDHRRPQAGVAAADDAQIARLRLHERRVGVGIVGVVVPVGEQLGVGDRVEVALLGVLVRVAPAGHSFSNPPMRASASE